MTKKELEAKIDALEEQLEEAYTEREICDLDKDVRKAVEMTYGMVGRFMSKGLTQEQAVNLTIGMIQAGMR